MPWLIFNPRSARDLDALRQAELLRIMALGKHELHLSVADLMPSMLQTAPGIVSLPVITV